MAGVIMTKKKILKEIKKFNEEVQQRYLNRKEGEWTEEDFHIDTLFAELAERISKLKADESEES